MKNNELEKHSEKIRNYLKSIIEADETVEEKEFIETYKKLSKGRRKGFNARHSFKELSKKKLIKFV